MNQHSRWNNLRTCKEFFHIARFSCNSYIWPKKNVWSCRKSDIWHKGKLFPCKYKTCAAMGMVYFVVGSNHSKGLQLKTKRNNSKLLHWIGMNYKKSIKFLHCCSLILQKQALTLYCCIWWIHQSIVYSLNLFVNNARICSIALIPFTTSYIINFLSLPYYFRFQENE